MSVLNFVQNIFLSCCSMSFMLGFLIGFVCSLHADMKFWQFLLNLIDFDTMQAEWSSYVCMWIQRLAAMYILCMCRAKNPTKKWIGHLISINKIKKEVLMEYFYLQCTHDDDMWHFDWRWWWGVERIYMITGGGAIKKFFGSCTDL